MRKRAAARDGPRQRARAARGVLLRPHASGAARPARGGAQPAPDGCFARRRLAVRVGLRTALVGGSAAGIARLLFGAAYDDQPRRQAVARGALDRARSRARASGGASLGKCGRARPRRAHRPRRGRGADSGKDDAGSARPGARRRKKRGRAGQRSVAFGGRLRRSRGRDLLRLGSRAHRSVRGAARAQHRCRGASTAGRGGGPGGAPSAPMRRLYSTLLAISMPFILLRLWWRGRREPGYRRNVAQRLGRYALPRAERLVWVHAVSVGEARAAAPLVRALQGALADHRVLMTCTTAAGRETLRQVYGDSIEASFVPYDLPSAGERFLGYFRPRLGGVMETEVWPHLINACVASG